MRHAITYFFIFTFALLPNIAYAATIHGTVYDFSLNKVLNSKVEINTAPKQQMIAKNGTYFFNVPNGEYTIKAEVFQGNEVAASVQENITVSQDGSYILDLILFPDVEEGVEGAGIDIEQGIVDKDRKLLWAVSFLLLILLVFGIHYARNRQKKEAKSQITEEPKQEKLIEDNDLNQIIKIISQEGGRATQKEIRKHIPLSEAKISLMISELEHKGIVEKIKKGRGNIIILKNKEPKIL